LIDNIDQLDEAETGEAFVLDIRALHGKVAIGRMLIEPLLRKLILKLDNIDIHVLEDEAKQLLSEGPERGS
jgi:hypothetical protein